MPGDVLQTSSAAVRVVVALEGGSLAVVEDNGGVAVRHRLAAHDILVVSPSHALVIGSSQRVELLSFQIATESLPDQHQALRSCCPFRFRNPLVASAARALGEQIAARQSLTHDFASAIVAVIVNEAARAQGTAAALPIRLVAPLSIPQLRRIDDYIDARLAEEVSLADLAKLTGNSVWHFMRRFKASRGTSPHAYIVERKLRCAADLITRSDLPIAEVARRIGLNRSHFSRAFKAHFAMSPRALRSSDPGSVRGLVPE
jgi:AraC-like DNA-binding protein